MNRQARAVSQVELFGEVRITPFSDWCSYGESTFFDAVRKTAMKCATPNLPLVPISIEVRDEHDPSIPPAVYHVEVVREARILNPRRDADKHEQAPTLAGVWRKILEAMPWRTNLT